MISVASTHVRVIAGCRWFDFFRFSESSSGFLRCEMRSREISRERENARGRCTANWQLSYIGRASLYHLKRGSAGGDRDLAAGSL